jgi:hypothetical protein
MHHVILYLNSENFNVWTSTRTITTVYHHSVLPQESAYLFVFAIARLVLSLLCSWFPDGWCLRGMISSYFRLISHSFTWQAVAKTSAAPIELSSFSCKTRMRWLGLCLYLLRLRSLTHHAFKSNKVVSPPLTRVLVMPLHVRTGKRVSSHYGEETLPTSFRTLTLLSVRIFYFVPILCKSNS